MREHRQARRNRLSRVMEMLLILQFGLCGRCGRACYTTRRTARRAARIAAPGIRLRAYRCDDAWHLTTAPCRPDLVDPPVTVPPVRRDAGLDLQGRGGRRYRNRHRGPRDGDRRDRTGLRDSSAEHPVGHR